MMMRVLLAISSLLLPICLASPPQHLTKFRSVERKEGGIGWYTAELSPGWRRVEDGGEAGTPGLTGQERDQQPGWRRVEGGPVVGTPKLTGKERDQHPGCLHMWLLPGCPLAVILGVDTFNTYDWRYLCGRYSQLREHARCDDIVENELLEELEALVYQREEAVEGELAAGFAAVEGELVAGFAADEGELVAGFAADGQPQGEIVGEYYLDEVENPNQFDADEDDFTEDDTDVVVEEKAKFLVSRGQNINQPEYTVSRQNSFS